MENNTGHRELPDKHDKEWETFVISSGYARIARGWGVRQPVSQNKPEEQPCKSHYPPKSCLLTVKPISTTCQTFFSKPTTFWALPYECNVCRKHEGSKMDQWQAKQSQKPLLAKKKEEKISDEEIKSLFK